MSESADSSVRPEELADRLRTGEPVSVLDVRDRDEFEAWRVDGPNVTAVQVPHVKFLQAKVQGTATDLVDGTGLDQPVVAVCARGEASAEVAEILRSAGVDAANLADGMEGWARVYVATEIPTDEAATVIQYLRPSTGCLAYLVVSGDEAALVDPLRAFADRYAADAAERGAELRYAVDTHVHADHLSGVRAVAAETGAEPVLPEGARERGLAFDARTVADGDELAVGETALTALAASGHTSEMTAFRVDDLLLTGDSLFLRSVARPDLEAGDEGAERLAHQLYRTLTDRFGDLPDDVRIAPGHISPATEPDDDGTHTAALGDLRERLDALSMDEDEFVAHVTGEMPPRPANFETIIAANLGREDVDDEAAFELELGPNNCAVS